jgi:hypothetical protein
MDTVLLKKSYQNSTRRITAACEGISATEATFRPYDKTNSLLWEVGHLMFFRNTICKILNPDEKLEALPNEREMFGFGSTLFDAAAYPSLDEVLTKYQQRGERVYELLDTVSAEHLAAESHLKIPVLGVTVANQAYSLLLHEANHYGELNVVKTLIHRLRA